MAFVYRATRQTEFNHQATKKLFNIGPGTYSNPKPEFPERVSNKEKFSKQIGRTGHSLVANRRSQSTEPGQQGSFQISNMTPGPGDYEMASKGGFQAIQKQKEQEHVMKKYGLESFGIQIEKNTANFASKQQRFQEPEMGPPINYSNHPQDQSNHSQQNAHQSQMKFANPGPGHYTVQSNNLPLRSHTQRGTFGIEGSQPQAFQQHKTKLMHAPSIPSHEFVYGYEENMRGELVRQVHTDMNFNGQGEDQVGPGQYNPKAIQESKIKGPLRKWDKPQPLTKKMKKIQLEKAGTKPGPGDYDNQDADNKPRPKMSSCFQSKTTRGFQEQQGMVMQDEQGGQKRAQSSLGGPTSAIQDIIEGESEDEQAPGPGAYQIQSTFLQKQKPDRHQFFGSSASRFPIKRQAASQTNLQSNGQQLGPGSYDPQQPIENSQKKPPTAKQVPFKVCANRWQKGQSLKSEDYDLENQLPGPGSYEENGIAQVTYKKTWGKNGIFGTTERRFATKEQLKVPGPGQYESQEATATMNTKDQTKASMESLQVTQQTLNPQSSTGNFKRCQSSMISKSQISLNHALSLRPKTGVNNHQKHKKSKKSIAGILQYDTQTRTISGDLRRKVDNISNPLLASLVKKGAQTPFNTAAARFAYEQPGAQKDEAQSFVGPGYYDKKSQFEGPKSLKAKFGSQSVTNITRPSSQCAGTGSKQFISGAVRFDYAAELAKLDREGNPAPGQYEDPRVGNWWKRSYNIDFSEG